MENQSFSLDSLESRPVRDVQTEIVRCKKCKAILLDLKFCENCTFDQSHEPFLRQLAESDTIDDIVAQFESLTIKNLLTSKAAKNKRMKFLVLARYKNLLRFFLLNESKLDASEFLFRRELIIAAKKLQKFGLDHEKQRDLLEGLVMELNGFNITSQRLTYIEALIRSALKVKAFSLSDLFLSRINSIRAFYFVLYFNAILFSLVSFKAFSS